MKESDTLYRETLRYKISNSKLGRVVMAIAMLPLTPVIDNIDRSRAEYNPVELSRQPELDILTANIHNQPLIQFFNSTFQEQDPLELLDRTKPDIACFQEISEEDALSLTSYGDVIFATNNDWVLNGRVGIALVSTREISGTKTTNLGSDEYQRPAIIASIDNLKIACLHLTSSTGLAEKELRKLKDLPHALDIIMGDLNLTPAEANSIIGDINYSSRNDEPTHPKTGRAIDRIILLDGSKILVWKFDSFIIKINSDHKGVIARIKPSSWTNVDIKELK
ncbi:MAG: endonuclease/exonuclease/phosphatase family protein [Candidatus Saccharimonadales bacterium]